MLSAGALCQNVLLAATALGFGGNWVTGWYAYDARARAMLGVGAPERPRPTVETVTSWLDAAAVAAA